MDIPQDDRPDITYTTPEMYTWVDETKQLLANE